MRTRVVELYLAQNWTKSHDLSCKMKLWSLLDRHRYYIILIFRLLQIFDMVIFFWEKNGCTSLKVHKKLSIVAYWIKESDEHLVMIYLLEVGQNYHILANTVRFDDIVYQISPHWRQQIAWFKILVYSVFYVLSAYNPTKNYLNVCNHLAVWILYII